MFVGTVLVPKTAMPLVSPPNSRMSGGLVPTGRLVGLNHTFSGPVAESRRLVAQSRSSARGPHNNEAVGGDGIGLGQAVGEHVDLGQEMEIHLEAVIEAGSVRVLKADPIVGAGTSGGTPLCKESPSVGLGGDQTDNRRANWCRWVAWSD